MELSLPTSRDFLFVVNPDKSLTIAPPEVTAGENTIAVSFRQGTTRDDAERTAFMNRRKFIFDAEARQMVEIAELSPDELARIEVSLSITATDLLLPGKVPLKFKTEFGVTTISDIVQFNTWWGMLPPQWGQKIYEGCLEVNPDWGPKSLPIL